MIKLYDTLTRKKQIFKPLKEGEIGIYTCGPTVYGPSHLGHARSYVNFDILKRVFLYNNYKVKHILNITDIHDSMIKKANELGITIKQLADKYTPLFLKELEELNIIHADEYPRVTESIPEIIKMIEVLIEKGYGYVEEDGSVYYNVSKFKEYGKLSGIKLEEAKTGTRVNTDEYKKESVADFVLWKGWKEGEPFWNSPWGKGRPGWHIECSVMSKKYLGETIDLHGGAMDLKFPHHENEIAQSEAANGVKFANYWFHGGLLDIENKKMSKSLGNYIEIHEIKERGFSFLALRYLFLTSHYSSKTNFSWKSLESAQNSLNNLYDKVRELKTEKNQKTKNKKTDKYKEMFLKYIDDDLNIPRALALTWDLIKDKNVSSKDKYKLLLSFDQVFGLNLKEVKEIKIPQEIKELAKQREQFRKANNWKEADLIRKEIEKLGFQVEDAEGKNLIKKINR